MEKRRLGSSDLEITPLGIGAWAMGGAGWRFSWGPQDDRDSITAIRCALESGINWIDTAAVYGLGHLVEQLRSIGKRHGRTPGEVAIAWTLRQPAVMGAIVGLRNAEQVSGVIGAAEFRLSFEQIEEIDQFLNSAG